MKTVRRGVVRFLTAGALVLAAGIVLGRAPAAQEAAEPARPEPPTKEQADAAAVLAALDALTGGLAWTAAEARAWWRRRAAGEGRPAGAAASRET